MSSLVSIVIPIYREAGFLERQLAPMVHQLQQYAVSYEVLLIEQFSDQATVDESLSVAARYPGIVHHLLSHPDFGAAMRFGLLQAKGDVIVNFDIDYWDVTFARMCLAILPEFEIDLIIGSKNARLSVDLRSSARRFISQGFRIVLQAVFGVRVSDTHGIKGWRNSERLRDLIGACRYTRDIFDTELVIRGERAGFRILELPVTVAEQREPRSSIFSRVPGAALNLLKLYFVLMREAPRRSAPAGAITPRPRIES